MGKVTKWIMSQEEIQAKYGPKSARKKPTGKEPKNWSWGKITLQEYAALKDRGITDAQILEKRPYMNFEKLQKLKKQWGIAK